MPETEAGTGVGTGTGTPGTVGSVTGGAAAIVGSGRPQWRPS